MDSFLLTRDQVRQVDQVALEQFHVPGILLMENAGRGAARCLIDEGIQGPVIICCGRGNNGGDGLVMARHLDNQGIPVRVLLFSSPDRLSHDATINYRILEAAGTPLTIYANSEDMTPGRLLEEFHGAEWICDALLGTGTTGAIQEPYATVIQTIEVAATKVLAVDLPSGLDCDTGEPLGPCVTADLTATFVAGKPGFATETAKPYLGRVAIIDIGVPRCVVEMVRKA